MHQTKWRDCQLTWECTVLPNMGFAYHCHQSTIMNHDCITSQQELYWTLEYTYRRISTGPTSHPTMSMRYQSVVLWTPSPGVQKCTILAAILYHIVISITMHCGYRTRTAHVVVLCVSTHVCRCWVPVIQSCVCFILQAFESNGMLTALEPSVTLSSRLPVRK